METRLKNIREKLKRGDINALALSMGVSREWVSKVLHGRGESQKVIAEAEALIEKKSKSN